MQCPKCQFENREGVKFCEEYGTKMERVCPGCGTTEYTKHAKNDLPTL